MAKHLVVVESPAKAQSINNYLGKDFKVMASYGHVRDLRAKEGAVDPQAHFAMHYELIARNREHVEAISRELTRAEDLYIATDPDREGEAIAWHLGEVLREKGSLNGKPIFRVVFHEITRSAVQEAIENPREITQSLVDAQQARRALDYLVGFNLSPLLWKKVRHGLSAGRVQSAALRLIAERETEIANFQPQEYWSIEADLLPTKATDALSQFTARLVEAEGEKLEKHSISEGKKAEKLRQAIEEAVSDGCLTVTSLERKQRKRNPAPPFITSTLQQEASRKLGFSVAKTMRVAQQLYEGVELGEGRVGLITYMRTDSVNIAAEALNECRELIQKQYGKDYLPDKPRVFKSQSKNAQEAHEGIRPTQPSRLPESIKDALTSDQFRLYALIWKRVVASQMVQARLETVTAHFEVTPGYKLRASGSTLTFPGFLRVYEEDTQEESGEKREEQLPSLSEGERVLLKQVRSEQHFTEPPPRFTEASLVKQLESYGIGRPSTYATILSTLQEREYATMDTKKRFHLTDVGGVVNRFLVNHFRAYVDYEFTARMEDDLDAIARGEQEWKPVLAEFWEPFHQQVEEKTHSLSRAEVTSEALDEQCPRCGRQLISRLGRHGRFIGCSGYPECDYTRPVAGQESPEPEMTDRKCPKCGKPLAIKHGRYGKFYGCTGYPHCKYLEPLEKPKGTGVQCPECGTGELQEKRSRRGRVFYGCSQYPNCKYAIPDYPRDEVCPECGSKILMEKTTKKHGREKVCPVKGCNFRAPLPESQQEEQELDSTVGSSLRSKAEL